MAVRKDVTGKTDLTPGKLRDGVYHRILQVTEMGPVSHLPSCYFWFPSLSDSGLYRAGSLLECPVHLDAVFKSAQPTAHHPGITA